MTKPRTVILALLPIAAISCYFLLKRQSLTLSDELQSDAFSANRGLLVYTAAFAANWLVAWKFKDHWNVTLIRLLLWGFLAYLCISDIIDIFAANREFASELIWPGNTDNIRIRAARLILASQIIRLAMALVCILLGFEKKVDKDDSRQSDLTDS